MCRDRPCAGLCIVKIIYYETGQYYWVGTPFSSAVNFRGNFQILFREMGIPKIYFPGIEFPNSIFFPEIRIDIPENKFRELNQTKSREYPEINSTSF